MLRPVKFHIINPVLKTINHTFVVVNEAPYIVKEAIKSLQRFSLSKNNKNILKNYYGSSWASLLAVDSKMLSKIGGEEDPIDLSQTEPSPDQTEDPNLDDFLDDIDALLTKPATNTQQLLSAVDVVDTKTTFVEAGVTYIFDIFIYPEDKISEIKDKLFLISNIPMYRQHLFWADMEAPATKKQISPGDNIFEDQTKLSYPYTIFINGVYEMSILETFTKYELEVRQSKQKQKQPVEEQPYKFKTLSGLDSMFGIPINRFTYAMRDDIKVEAYDTFKLLGDIQNFDRSFYIVDINTLLDPIKVQINELIKDSYQFELFYYGFIILFWPQMTPEVFKDYLVSESHIFQKYDDLAKSRTILSKMFAAEAVICNKNYNYLHNTNNNSYENLPKFMDTAVTKVTVTNNSNKKIPINCRNLFDRLQLTDVIQQVNAYVTVGSNSFLLKKIYSKNQREIQFPSVFKKGVTLAILFRQEKINVKLSTIENEQSKYLFLNILPDGKYYIKAIFNEEEGYQFKDVLAIMKKYTTSILALINTMSKYVFISGGALEPLTESNIVYFSMNVCIFWKRLMSFAQFKFVKGLLADYIAAGIIENKSTGGESEVYEFIFKKGIYDFNYGLIEKILYSYNIEKMKNYYARLTTSSIKQKWDQIYSGRTVKMYHRTTDVKFEVIGIKEKEFMTFINYITVFIYKAVCNKLFSRTVVVKTYDTPDHLIPKLKKLKEIDPNLYNLRKFGSEKVYSILCQNPRQPVIYTEDELADMSAADKKKLIKYWNFTLNREAYYNCPSRKYPHFSFITGLHPKHYCLPCCGKSDVTPGTKKSEIVSVCFNKKQINIDEFLKSGDKVADSTFKHIVTYGKEIEPGRLSYLPQSAITKLFYNSLDTDEEPKPNLEYIILGVNQNYPAAPSVGMLASICEILNMPHTDVIKAFISGLSNSPLTFNTLLNGNLLNYFQSAPELILAMKNIFIDLAAINLTDVSRTFKKWNELFIELAMIFLNLYIIVFVDKSGTGESTNLKISNEIKSEILQQSIISKTEPTTTKPAKNVKYGLIIQRMKTYYPIIVVNLDTYLRSQEISIRAFHNSHKIIDYIYQIIISESDTKTADKPINLYFMQEFVNYDKKYKIVTKFINMRNLCYAVMLEISGQKIYISIDYSSYSSDGVQSQFEPLDYSSSALSYAHLKQCINSINSYIVEYHEVHAKTATYEGSYNFKPLSVQKKVVSNKNQPIGLTVNDLLYYLTDLDTAEAPELDKIPIWNLTCDLFAVNKAIVARSQPVPDKRITQIGESLYHTNIYQLFLLEFVNYMEQERNEELRKQIMTLISVSDFKHNLLEFQKNLKDIIMKNTNGTPQTNKNDYLMLQAQLSEFYSMQYDEKLLIANINMTVYEFDRISMNKFKNLGFNSLKTELKKIVGEFATEGKIEKSINFSNVYLPCSYTISATGNQNSINYCDKRQLIIDPAVVKIDDLVSILAYDILNPLKVRYMFSGIFTDNVISYFNFESHPNEIIRAIPL